MLRLLDERNRPRHVRQNILSAIIENRNPLVSQALVRAFKKVGAAALGIHAEGGRKEGGEGA